MKKDVVKGDKCTGVPVLLQPQRWSQWAPLQQRVKRGPHVLLPSALAVSIVTDGRESTADVAQYMIEVEDTTVEGQI